MQEVLEIQKEDEGKLLYEINQMVSKLTEITNAQSLVRSKIKPIGKEIASRKSRKTNQASLFSRVQTNYGKFTTEQLRQTQEKLKYQYANLSEQGSQLFSQIIAAKRKYHKTFPGHPSSVFYT